MKHPFLFAITLLLTSAIPGFGNSSFEKKRSHLQKLRTEGVKNQHLSPLDRAYLDTYGMLSGDNPCALFFGGSGSRHVLEEFIIRLQPETITDTRIAIRMLGAFISYVDPKGGIEYRLFEQAEINSRGAFYRSKTFPSEPLVPNMGSFRPNTRQARVLILLHELAHIIKGWNGAWLIPDDGSDARLSRSNTWIIESKCGPQIRSL